VLSRWVDFYEMIYSELDEVERPHEKTIKNDKKLDKWLVDFRARQKKKLIEYHKNDKSIDRDPLDKPTMVYGK